MPIFGKLLNRRENNDPDSVYDILAELVKSTFQPNNQEGRTQKRCLVIDDGLRISCPDLANMGAGLKIEGGMPEEQYGNTSRYVCRIRDVEEDTEHGCIPAPKTLITPDQEDMNNIACHPMAVSQETSDGEMTIPQKGDIVWCYRPPGSADWKIQKEYIQKNDSTIGSLTPKSSPKGAFSGKGRKSAPLGQYGATGGLTDRVILGSDATYALMSSIYPSSQYHPNLLFGLMANVQAESAFEPNIGGDPSNSSRTLESWGSDPVEGVRRYCSHGMFQMNVCGGMGTAFLEYHNVDHKTDPVRAKQLLNDPRAQFEFVRDNQLPKGASADQLKQPLAPDGGPWSLWFQQKYENHKRSSIRNKYQRELTAKYGA